MIDQNTCFECPSELDFLEFFGVEPEKVGEGRYLYEVLDSNGISLRFSFDVHEESVQTALFLGQQRVAVVSHEGIRRIWFETIRGITALRAELASDTYTISLALEISPRISISWAGLKVCP
jgi:hypothetical protein